jgi:hypothetical protein
LASHRGAFGRARTLTAGFDGAASLSLVRLSGIDGADFGRRPIVAEHGLRDSPLFDDATLADLLDGYPRELLHVLVTGSDPQRPEDNRVAIHDGVSGSDLMRAVRNGRLWLNVTRVDRADARFRNLIDSLYEDLSAQLPDFHPTLTQGTLLISSPHAVVYYHLDGPASVLWHVRGRKRIWVYPALDPRYAHRHDVEDIIAGVRHEYLPFDPAFDDGAAVFDLNPGQWIAWAQNAPHRVTNLDSINVSLSTEHFTAQTRTRARIYSANRFLRLRVGLRDLSTREQGVAAITKTAIHWAARRVGIDRPANTKRHVPTLRIDPDVAGATRALGERAAERSYVG